MLVSAPAPTSTIWRARWRTSRQFTPGEVYNIGGDDVHSIEEASRIIFRQLGRVWQRGTLIVTKPEEMLTTREKRVDCDKARRDLRPTSMVTLEEGIRGTLDWMKGVYRKRGLPAPDGEEPSR